MISSLLLSDYSHNLRFISFLKLTVFLFYYFNLKMRKTLSVIFVNPMACLKQPIIVRMDDKIVARLSYYLLLLCPVGHYSLCKYVLKCSLVIIYIYIYIHTCMYTYIYIYKYIYVYSLRILYIYIHKNFVVIRYRDSLLYL